jgi:hypothetical protein
LTTGEIPNEPQCLSDEACTDGAIMLFGSGSDAGELISEVHAELNDVAIDLTGT